VQRPEARADAAEFLDQRCGADIVQPALDKADLARVCRQGPVKLALLLIDYGADVRA
jgi:hypothetical protein